MGDVPSKEGDRVGGVKKLIMGDLKEVTSPLYSSRHPQREIWLSWGHVELIWASDGVLWGDRWTIGLEKQKNLLWEILKGSLPFWAAAPTGDEVL